MHKSVAAVVSDNRNPFIVNQKFKLDTKPDNPFSDIFPRMTSAAISRKICDVGSFFCLHKESIAEKKILTKRKNAENNEKAEKHFAGKRTFLNYFDRGQVLLTGKPFLFLSHRKARSAASVTNSPTSNVVERGFILA